MNRDKAPTSPTPVREVSDVWPRLIGIPAFGLLIPHLTGLFGDIPPTDIWFWLGTLLFVALAWAVWEGNRWLLFAQRRNLDWFSRPVYKIIALVFACTFYTAPVTALILLGWYELAPLPLSVDTILVVTLTNVICVLFVTHAYETAFLIKGRALDTESLSELRQAVTAAQLDALRRRVDPHFLFNSLNVLGALIESEPEQAARFNSALADVYRYLLDDRDLVSLEEEIEFVRAYCTLMHLRYGSAVEVAISSADVQAQVPPTSLQTLVENAVKHTAFDRNHPLEVSVTVRPTSVRVENRKRPRPPRSVSSRLGLRSLDERCQLLIGKPLSVSDDGDRFVVDVPLLVGALG